MRFLFRIFGSRSNTIQQPSVLFGRYSDSYKETTKYDAWDQAIKKYEEKSYLESFRYFFDYLRDDDEDNVVVEEKDDALHFELLQGSKKIWGTANEFKVKAESKIAKTSNLSIGFMRRMIENNYTLKYGRYCLDPDNDISIVFDTLTIDGSPYKLYYALKEISLAADKQDDLLIEEFDALESVNTGHIVPLSEQEKSVKTSYLRRSIEEVVAEVEEGALNVDQYPGGTTYLLLETVYRLDFLVRPEGHAMEAFERMHRNYFAVDGNTNKQKNKNLLKELKKLITRSDEQLREELYRTTSTFGITNPSSHERLKTFIEGEIKNIDWYIENKYNKVALSIPGYIAGYTLFYFSVPEPDKDLILLYFQIIERDYFGQLGFQLPDYHQEDILRKSMIRAAVQD
ncbi:MAG: hypothetical protein OEQ53_04375, partial [Saprospiraceae bacterium]|nr:hypothetical protein [Saprospiraceae bacterium]